MSLNQTETIIFRSELDFPYIVKPEHLDQGGDEKWGGFLDRLNRRMFEAVEKHQLQAQIAAQVSAGLIVDAKLGKSIDDAVPPYVELLPNGQLKELVIVDYLKQFVDLGFGLEAFNRFVQFSEADQTETQVEDYAQELFEELVDGDEPKTCLTLSERMLARSTSDVQTAKWQRRYGQALDAYGNHLFIMYGFTYIPAEQIGYIDLAQVQVDAEELLREIETVLVLYKNLGVFASDKPSEIAKDVLKAYIFLQIDKNAYLPDVKSIADMLGTDQNKVRQFLIDLDLL